MNIIKYNLLKIASTGDLRAMALKWASKSYIKRTLKSLKSKNAREKHHPKTTDWMLKDFQIE